MTMRLAWVRFLVVVSVCVVLSLALISCGSHAPTLPSPDVGGGGGDWDVLEVEDFIVAAREVREFVRNTIVRASGIVLIDGAVIGADGSGPGQAGVSIVIEAEGDVTVNGTVKAGDGGQAVDTLHVASKQADQTAGGDGGGVTLTSNQANVTLGEGAHVVGGDGANGGNSLTGGPGGRGGDVSINAPEGTATIPDSDDLIHMGNGADGGEGDIQGDDITTFPGMDEPTANGGRGGKLEILSQTLVGMDIQGTAPDEYILLEAGDGRFTGGGGGDGGPVTLGEEPQNGASASAASATGDVGRSRVSDKKNGEHIDWVHAGNGADGYATDDGGKPGDGDQAQHGLWTTAPAFAGHAGGLGGNGGDQAFNTWTASDGRELPIVPRKTYAGGNGGAAQVHGRDGMDSRACERPTDGHSATAAGGAGGRVREEQVPSSVWRIAPMNQSQGGSGGWAHCTAGDGGDAGDCCDPPGNGYGGGDAGRIADAIGGAGGDQTLLKGGSGPWSHARGAYGGDGADGRRMGSGGSTSTTVTATGGRGGTGSPGGGYGVGEVSIRNDGRPGERCTGDAPPPTGYHVLTRELNSQDARYYVKDVPGLWPKSVPPKSGARPAQATGVAGRTGPSMWVALDGGRLFLAHYDNGIQVWDNPVAGVDATPDFLLTPDGLALAEIKAQSAWLDEANDNLYGLFIDTVNWRSHVYVWRNASAITANRAADSGFILPAGKRGTYLVGGANQNVLFIGGGIISDIYVIDNPAGRNGEVSPDRTITDTRPHGSGLAYDDTHNILYAFREDTGGLRRHTIRVIANASAADGAPTFHEFYDTRLGDPYNAVVGLQVIGDQDLLFVGNQDGVLLVFGGASGLEGEVTADVSYEPDDYLQNIAVWYSTGP